MIQIQNEKRNTILKIIISFLFLFVIFIYVIIMNFIAFTALNPQVVISDNNTISQNGNKINIGDSVHTILVDENWYGVIVKENLDDGTRYERMYLFNIINLPLKVNKQNYVIYHIVFSFIIIYSFIMWLVIMSYRKTKKLEGGEITNGKN